jgi:hypothetical protein
MMLVIHWVSNISLHKSIIIIKAKLRWFIHSLFICYKFKLPIKHKGRGVEQYFVIFPHLHPSNWTVEQCTCELTIVFAMWKASWLQVVSNISNASWQGMPNLDGIPHFCVGKDNFQHWKIIHDIKTCFTRTNTNYISIAHKKLI